MIPPLSEEEQPGSLRDIEEDFAAVITPGLELAFIDRELIAISAVTIFGETCQPEVGVCGPGAFIVLKALAFRNRGQATDAYDLYYVVRNYGAGLEEVADRYKALIDHPEARRVGCPPRGLLWTRKSRS